VHNDPGLNHPTSPAADSGDRIAGYRLLRVLGEGGMGVVYLAEQTEPVRREIALKVVKPGMDTAQVVARFEAERQALAVMEHPGIARVFDAGATETGRPFFVMERVDGVPITDYCDGQRLGLRARARLFVQVCRAVQHAHQKGVIHRDLKPSNVLVTVPDDEPVCKVIDFGIARAVEPTAQDATRLTQLGMSPGTPAYMSPEQVDAGGRDIDTRSDIYSLGVLLYELLAGVLPFEDEAYVRWALYANQLVREPPTPSVRFGELEAAQQDWIAAARRADPAAVRRGLRGDLDWIVMRTLEKERDRRYDTANGLAMDLERYLASEPVSAGPPGAGYRARKFVRRHRAAVAFAAVLVVLLIGFAGAMGVQAERVARARDLAVARQGQAEDLIGFMVGDLRAKLAPVGRLDILDDVGQRALAYFAAVPEAELSDEELFRRAEAIRQIGEVRVEQGTLDAAMDAFRDALTLQQELVRRDPDNPEWQVSLSTAHFWVGYMHWFASDLDGALAEFLVYRTIAERLVERDPTNDAWVRELGHAHSNLGSVQEARGDLEGAMLSFHATRAVHEQLVQLDPDDRDKRFNLAIAHNKIATVAQKLGRFAEAEHDFGLELAIKEALVAEYPEDVPLREHLGLAHATMGRVLTSQGSVAAAIPSFETALEIFRWLVAQDPSNSEWRRSVAFRLIDLGSAREHLGDRTAASGALAEARAMAEDALGAEPSNPSWRRALAWSHRGLGRARLAAGDAAAALRDLEASRAVLEALVEDAPANRSARRELAETLVLLGDARASVGDGRQNDMAWREARRVLEPLMNGATEIEVEALWAATLLRTGPPAEAEALARALMERGYREPGFAQLMRHQARPD
jgi:eukaryotic-like serine/threonine-protein kinase